MFSTLKFLPLSRIISSKEKILSRLFRSKAIKETRNKKTKECDNVAMKEELDLLNTIFKD